MLSLGEKVTVVSENGDYYQILPPKGSTAWVVSRNVKREGEAGTVLGSDVPVRLDSRVNADQVATLAGHAVLTVGTEPGFTMLGGMIGLREEGRRIAFDANPSAIRQSRVVVSARVLQLARVLPSSSSG